MASQKDRVSSMLHEFVQLWYIDWPDRHRLDPEVAERVPMFLLGPVHSRYRLNGQLRITKREIKHATERAREMVEAERLNRRRNAQDQQIKRCRRRRAGAPEAHITSDRSLLDLPQPRYSVADDVAALDN